MLPVKLLTEHPKQKKKGGRGRMFLAYILLSPLGPFTREEIPINV